MMLMLPQVGGRFASGVQPSADLGVRVVGQGARERGMEVLPEVVDVRGADDHRMDPGVGVGEAEHKRRGRLAFFNQLGQARTLEGGPTRRDLGPDASPDDDAGARPGDLRDPVLVLPLHRRIRHLEVVEDAPL